MKKSFLTNIIAGSLFLCMALVSCGRKTVLIDDQLPKLTKAPPKVTEPDVVVPDEEEEEAAETTAVDMNDPDTTPHLKWGVWFAYNETESRYYIFENDNSSGTKISAKTGITTPFKYERSENNYVFHFDREDNNTPAAMQYTDSDNAVAVFSEKVTEKMSYVSNHTFADFTFFTMDELEQMAINRYSQKEKNKNKIDMLKLQTATNEKAQAVIQLYIMVVNQETGKEEAKVLECYTVNHTDACGTDAAGNTVDLSS